MIELNTAEDIRLLAESSDLECKRAAGRDGKGALPNDFWESYSAMANTEGGTILLGIRQKGDKFQLHGIELVNKVQKDLFDTANNRSKVSSNLLTNDAVQVIEIDGKTILQVSIRRAARQKRPVYLNGNPLGNTYVHMHEGDQRLSDEAVKRMLAEQVEDSRDMRILKGFGLQDLSQETLKSYRQVFTNRQPDHPWNEQDTISFLRSVGGWRTDRETGLDGLTAAGLLMFGYHTTIQEAYPNYMLDYQERPEAKTDRRWVDRITLDGTWSGNLYDFYRKVYPKLTEDLKIPFELDGDQRIDESPAHVAVREALCNVLVHADYSDRCSVLVVKRPDLFGFRNPGLMRIPLEFALQGGHPDCRNRSLHQMFRYVGIGDQAGSGIPKILSGWNSYHWRPPELKDTREPSDQTILQMRMVDLLPAQSVDLLKTRFGAEAYDAMSNIEHIALVIAAVEGTVTHQRLCALGSLHSADAGGCLRSLVDRAFLEQTGSSRGAVYHLAGMDIPGPEDVFDSRNLEQSSRNLEPSSGINEPSSGINEPSSRNLEPSSGINESSSGINEPSSGINESSSGINGTDNRGPWRNADGLLVSPSHTFPFVNDLTALSPEYRGRLEDLAAEPNRKERLSRQAMRDVLLVLTEGHFITLDCLSELTDRKGDSLRRLYLSKMVKEGTLNIAFPRTPNDPRQAYTKAGGHQ